MAMFTSTNDVKTKLTTIQLPKGDIKRVYLVDVKARISTDISLKVGAGIKATIKSAPFDGPKGIWVIDISGNTIGKTSIEANFNGSIVATASVDVFEKVIVTFPLPNTVEGTLTRLFLAESINPSDKKYNADESKKSMIWMRKVIENRLASKKPSIFNVKVSPGKSVTINDIIKALNQFHGFEKYPELNGRIKINLNGFIDIANNYNHPLREKYLAFIQNAINASSQDALRGFLDPSPKGLYGWKTQDSIHPGGDFKVYMNLAGQTFYTLK